MDPTGTQGLGKHRVTTVAVGLRLLNIPSSLWLIEVNRGRRLHCASTSAFRRNHTKWKGLRRPPLAVPVSYSFSVARESNEGLLGFTKGGLNI